jgi:hypothetical protein
VSAVRNDDLVATGGAGTNDNDSADIFEGGANRAPLGALYLAPSPIHGLGVFTRFAIKCDVRIGLITGPFVRRTDLLFDDSNLVGVAPDLWIDPDFPLRHVNHSCIANTAIGKRRQLYALADIAPGAELTLDYSTTECDPHWRMDCSCGFPNCRNRLLPVQLAFAALPPAPPAMQRAWRRLRQNDDD